MSFAIDSNDVALAHGAAKWLCDVEPVRKLFDAILKQPVREHYNATHVDRLIPPSLGKYLIYRNVKKSHGRRACGIWLLLLPRQTCFSVAEIRLQKGQCYLDELNVLVSHHCFARLMQRSSKTSDVATTVGFVKNHLLALVVQKIRSPDFRSLNDGSEIATIDARGKLLLGVGDGCFMAKTWVDADQFHSEDRAVIEGAADNEVRFRWYNHT